MSNWGEILKQKAALLHAAPAPPIEVPVAVTPAVQTSAPAPQHPIEVSAPVTAACRKHAERAPQFPECPDYRTIPVEPVLTTAQQLELAQLIHWWYSERHTPPVTLVVGRFPWTGPAVAIIDPDRFRAWMDALIQSRPKGYVESNLYWALKLVKGAVAE